MKLLKLKQNTPQWLEWRKRKITGTKGDMIPSSGSVPKKDFFDYIAERSYTEPLDETDLQRGNRLEPIARELIAKELGKNLTYDYVVEGDDNYALSPDALVVTDIEPTIELITEAVEIKCPNNANHAQIIYINRAFQNDKKSYPRKGYLANYGVPSDYHNQVFNYFLRLPNLQTLYFSVYNENAPVGRKLLILPIKREDIADEIEKYSKRMKEILIQAKDYIEWLEFENALQ